MASSPQMSPPTEPFSISAVEAASASPTTAAESLIQSCRTALRREPGTALGNCLSDRTATVRLLPRGRLLERIPPGLNSTPAESTSRLQVETGCIRQVHRQPVRLPASKRVSLCFSPLVSFLVFWTPFTVQCFPWLTFCSTIRKKGPDAGQTKSKANGKVSAGNEILRHLNSLFGRGLPFTFQPGKETYGNRCGRKPAYVLRAADGAIGIGRTACPSTGSLSTLDAEWGQGILWAHSISEHCLYTFHDLQLNTPVKLTEFPSDYICVTSMTDSSAKLCPVTSRYLRDRNTVSFHQDGGAVSFTLKPRGAPPLLYDLYDAGVLRRAGRIER